MQSLQALETLDAPRLRPVRCALVNQRDTLLAFATGLDQGLDALAQRFAVPVFRLRQVLALQERASATPAYWFQVAALASTRSTVSSMQSTRPSWRSAIACTAPAPWWRTLIVGCATTSSCAARRGPQYLDLLRFFLNHSPFPRSQHPGRVGKTPAELLTGQAHPHWLELLGFTRFQRSPQAT
jgi:hypothetical protein